MVLLSLDISTKATGYALWENNKLVDYGVFTASSPSLVKRIHKITDAVAGYLEGKSVDTIIAEEVRPATEINKQTNRALMWMQGYIGVMLEDKFGWKFEEYLLPSEWRKICGIKQGRGVVRDSQKIYDIEWAKHQYGFDELTDDEADAIGIGYAYLHRDGKVSSFDGAMSAF